MPRAKTAPKMTTPEMVRIQIGNLSALTTEAGLHTLFSRYGFVGGYDRPMNPGTDLPGTLASVEMSAEDAEKAVAALDGSMVDGQELRVSLAPAKASKRAPAKPAARTSTAKPAASTSTAKAAASKSTAKATPRSTSTAARATRSAAAARPKAGASTKARSQQAVAPRNAVRSRTAAKTAKR